MHQHARLPTLASQLVKRVQASLDIPVFPLYNPFSYYG